MKTNINILNLYFIYRYYIKIQNKENNLVEIKK